MCFSFLYVPHRCFAIVLNLTTCLPDSLRSDGKVGVLNTQRDGSPSNPTKNITGYAYIPDPSKPGELLVHLEGVPIDAPYWVLETGPIVNGLYDYSIVSDSFQVTLFLLVRDLERYHAKYEDYLNKRLEQLGFTNFLNKPVKIVQDGCWN